MKTLIAILAFSTVAIAGTTDDHHPDSAYLSYGEGFAPYTAKLTAKDSSGRAILASATLIADTWALTAAHVVHGATNFEVDDVPVLRVYIHPDFDDDRVGWNDIAMLESSQPFGRSFYPPLATGRESVGQTVSIAGYGVHGRLSVGHTESDGRLRAGTNTIARFERMIIVCHAGRMTSPLELCISPGDSGGPLFCNGALTGINSFTMADKGPLRSRAGEESGHTRVSLYREWIGTVMEVGE